MPIVKITGHGLAAIALSVALLWGCWMEEQAILRRDHAERARVLRDLQQLQRPHAPASNPAPVMSRAPRVTAG
jgi:cytochrome b